MKFKTTMLVGAFLSSILAAHSVAAISSPLFIENPRDEMPELVMPSSRFLTIDRKAATETDPRSRKTISDFIGQHQGLEWEDAFSGSRQHLIFEKGVHGLNTMQKEILSDFVSKLPPYSRVVVSGFADDDGTADANLTLAENRAKRVAAEILGMREDIDVTILWSVLWPGDPGAARRAEIVELKGKRSEN